MDNLVFAQMFTGLYISCCSKFSLVTASVGFCGRCAAAAEGQAASLQPGPGGGCLLADKLLGIFVGFANRFSLSLFIIFYHLNNE